MQIFSFFRAQHIIFCGVTQADYQTNGMIKTTDFPDLIVIKPAQNAGGQTLCSGNGIVAILLLLQIGLLVLANGVEIGKITEVLTPPGNDVYVVKGEHEYLIPVVKEFVEEIDTDAGYVKVRLIEGMRTDAD